MNRLGVLSTFLTYSISNLKCVYQDKTPLQIEEHVYILSVLPKKNYSVSIILITLLNCLTTFKIFLQTNGIIIYVPNMPQVLCAHYKIDNAKLST